DGDSELRCHGVVEKFVVGGPPEGVVDDVSSLQHGVLQVAAVVFDLVGDAVDDDLVLRPLAHASSAKLHEFGGDAVFLAQLVHADDKCGRKTVFAPAEKANLNHVRAPVRQFEVCARCAASFNSRHARKKCAVE